MNEVNRTSKPAGRSPSGPRKAADKSARTRAREFALQALYQHLVGRNGANDIDSFTRDLIGFHKADAAHFDALLHGCIRAGDALDAMISPHLDRKLAEVSPIEHGALWIGAYELQHCPDVPWRVVINECIELPLRDGEVISRADLQACLARDGLRIEPGDVVLLHTGWLATNLAKQGPVDFNAEPGIDHEAGLWLAQQDVAMIGADNFAVEVLPFAQGTVFPVHQCVIRDFGVPLIEGLELGPLAQTGRREFLFMAAALPIVGATGSPLSPLAVL